MDGYSEIDEHVFCVLCGEPLCKNPDCLEHPTMDWDYVEHMERHNKEAR